MLSTVLFSAAQNPVTDVSLMSEVPISPLFLIFTFQCYEKGRGNDAMVMRKGAVDLESNCKKICLVMILRHLGIFLGFVI